VRLRVDLDFHFSGNCPKPCMTDPAISWREIAVTLRIPRQGFCARVRIGQGSYVRVEFKTQEEVVFIRRGIAYDGLVRASRPARDRR
jgi:hypothetical protein